MERGKLHSEKTAQVSKICTIIVFFIVLFLPLLGIFFKGNNIQLVNEKRQLSKRPEFRLKSLRKFSKEFEQYFNDRIPFRDLLIFTNSFLKMRYLGTSPVPKVIIGKEGWLFYRGDNVANVAEGYFLAAPLRKEQLALLQVYLEAKRDWLAERGIKYLFVIAPDKQSIYPEFLPDSYYRAASHIDQLKEYLKTNSDIDIVDLRQPLLRAKRDYPVFYKSDTHWNEYGAFISCIEIIKSLTNYFPTLQIPQLSDYPIRYETVNGRDLADMLAMGNFISEAVPRPIRLTSQMHYQDEPSHGIPITAKIDPQVPFATERMGGELPRGVMFGDSFSVSIGPFLSESFSRIAYVHIHLSSLALQQKVIEQETPNVVIDEIVERSMSAFLTIPVPQDMLDALYRKRFNESTGILTLINSESGYQGVLPLNEVNIFSEKIDQARVLLLRAIGGDPSIQLPDFPFPKGKHVIMRVDIASSADTTLQIFFQTTKSRAYTEAKSIRRSINKGRNILYIPLSEADLYGNIRLDPGDVPGDYYLYSVEIRAVRKIS